MFFKKKGKDADNKVKEIAGKVLGSRTGEYRKYSPEVLVAVPRNLSIEHIGVKMEDLPGQGFDTWYSYEFRCLTNQGLPIASALKFVFPHSSKNIIESKSLKLYCNSFASEKMGKTKEEVLKKCCEIMRKDLSKVAEGNVEVSVVTCEDKEEIFNNYVDLMGVVRPDMEVSVYNEDPSLLQIQEVTEEKRQYRFKFDALRSTCRITKQPDSGTAYIYYESNVHINEESLVRYLASFYEEHHFHEEILVTIFTRLAKLLKAEDSLFVTALYQRRGSLDIGPYHYMNIDSNSPEFQEILSLMKPEVFAYDPNNLYR